MIPASVVKMETTLYGYRLAAAVRMTAKTRAPCMAVTAILFMGPVCRFPQYWLQKITSPSPMAVNSC